MFHQDLMLKMPLQHLLGPCSSSSSNASPRNLPLHMVLLFFKKIPLSW